MANDRSRDEDVCETLYKDTLKIAHTGEHTSQTTDQANGGPTVAPGAGAPSKESKVNRICDGFLSVLNNRIDTNLQNLVTAHVCKSPPDLDAGLQLVAKLRGTSRGPSQPLREPYTKDMDRTKRRASRGGRRAYVLPDRRASPV